MEGNKILDGMTKEEAIKFVKQIREMELGVCLMCKLQLLAHCPSGDYDCEKCCSRGISAYYAERDKPRWKEPDWKAGFGLGEIGREFFYSDAGSAENAAEIARTNARRFLEAWRDLNGGPGEWGIWKSPHGWEPLRGGFDKIPECITYATKETAQYIIDNHSEPLRLLNGGRG
jgi:hypothetical protein